MSIANNPFKDTLHKKNQKTDLCCFLSNNDQAPYTPPRFAPDLKYHQEFQVPKMEGFLNLMGGHFGDGKIPLHKPYPYSLYDGEDSSIWMVPEMSGDNR